jgi:hypothetical protein
MKKIIALTVAGFLGLSLVGCNTIAIPTTTTATVADLQAAVVAACGFLPAATTIASILSANPAIATGGEIASVICQAVTKKAAHKGGYSPATIIVNGKVILINGEFVK